MPAFVVANVDIPSKLIAPGVQMPIISIGDGGQETSKSSVITESWLKLGGRSIDTAYMYGNQKSVAKSITAVGLDRKDVFITTKIPGCSNVEANIESNLKDLGTDYIDLLLIHFPYQGDCAAAWATLESYHAKGTAKAIGVSNYKRS